MSSRTPTQCRARSSSTSWVHRSQPVGCSWSATSSSRSTGSGGRSRRSSRSSAKSSRRRDIALLVRAMTDVGAYESALADEGFDYHVVGGSAFYAQQEVHDLINVLSVIEDPLDAVSLAGALRSPFFCVSDDGLYWLATSRF